MDLTLNHLKQLWGDPIYSDQIDTSLDIPLGPVCTDSRQFRAGCFFVPLHGQHFDGHNFLHKVVDLGAQAAVIERSSKIKIRPVLI